MLHCGELLIAAGTCFGSACRAEKTLDKLLAEDLAPASVVTGFSPCDGSPPAPETARRRACGL